LRGGGKSRKSYPPKHQVAEQANMKNIGLITYHATHNYGAVLQAYATQKTIENMGFNCKIINFQPDTMKYFNALYKLPTGGEIPITIKGIVAAIYRVLRYFTYDKKRRIRAGKFVDFVRTRLNITREYNSVKALSESNLDYDIVITGSDQTWNIHCPLWKVNGRINDYSAAYFLGFVKSGKKASFAASTSHTKADELEIYRDLLMQYEYLTVRDSLSKPEVEAVTNKDIHVVLDPVFLLSKEEWMESLNIPVEPYIKTPYALLYSISGHKELENLAAEAAVYARNKSLALVCVTPNACVKIHDSIQIYDAGPSDFLNLYYNARFVFAHTFHAIVFSIVFRKPFFAFNYKHDRKDIRKSSLLKMLNMDSLLLDEEHKMNTDRKMSIDYRDYENTINHFIVESKKHLEKILNLTK
jgi:hypothetical protein